MKKYVKKTIDDLDDITCDVCKSSCKKHYNIESATLSAYWGYDSKRDGEAFDIDICESCFDKLIKFMSDLRGEPIEPTSTENII
jgi:hypothetical protein